MSSNRFGSLLARVALSLGALTGAGMSQAAVYGGHWDPLYGEPFPNLGWTADATFVVPDACLAQVSGSCSVTSFLSAEVGFYQATDLTRTLLEVFEITNPGSVQGTATVQGGQVVGVTSSGFFDAFVPGPNGPASSIDGGGNYAFNLILGTGSDREAQLYYSPPSGIESCFDETERHASTNAESDVPRCGQSTFAAVGTFAAVPEPGSAVLALTSIGLLATVSRRRRFH